MLTHSNIFSDLVRDLDAQLNHFGAAAHVTVGFNDSPALVGIGHDLPAPIVLDHPAFGSFVEAELIAARLNALQGIGDRQRVAILQRMLSTKSP